MSDSETMEDNGEKSDPTRRKANAALAQPRGGLRFGLDFVPGDFGEFSESVARLLGTAKFLGIQTLIVLVWIILNVFAVKLRWDPYPFILLNLAFSTQAAYAAPLILLAQSRQADRDRAQAERDRAVNNRTQADTEFLARELASVRLSLSDVVTNEDLSDAVERLAELLRETPAPPPESPGSSPSSPSK